MPTDTAAGRPIAKGERAPRSRSRRLALSERAAVVGLLGLVFSAVLLFGASEIAVAAVFAGLYPLYLLILLVTCDWARRDLGRMPWLATQAALFAVLIAVVLWPLGAWGGGGPHPVWAYLPGQAGSLTVDRSALLLNVLQLLGLGCLFVSGRIIGESEARGSWFLKAAVAALGVYAALALVDHVGVRRNERLAATLLSPNTAATVFGAGMMLAVAATMNRFRRFAGLSVLRRGDPQAMAWLSVVALLATVLLMTASRAGVVATLLGLGLVLAWNAFAQRQNWRGAVGLVAAASVLLVAAVALRSLDQLTDRFSLTGRDIEVRSIIFAPHWQAFLSTPWSGFGLGAFPTVNQLIVTGPSLSILYDIRAAHNLYLQWLEEGGVLGAAAMLAVFVSLILPILRGGLADSSTGVWARATACAAVVFLAHGMTDFALQAPAVQALCAMVLGVVGGMALGRRAKRPATARPPWPIAAVAAATVLAAMLAGAPLVASRVGGDLSSWPTASADALAASMEASLAQPHLDAAQLKRLDSLSARELAMRPASGAAWLRRAVIDAARGDDQASNTALERSFAVAPLQSSLFDRRTVFAYERWGRLSQGDREAAAYHLRAEWKRSNRPARFVAMANSLRDPTGRVGMAMQVAVLRMTSRR